MQPVRPTPILLAVAAAAASGLVAACSRNPPPELPGSRFNCPPPMMWRAGEPRPRLIRIVNQSTDSVVVFTDDCMAGTRVGDLGPGRARSFALPERLVVYQDGLRLHVVRGAGSARPEVVVTAIAVDTARVLHLEVPEELPDPCPIDVFVDGKPFKGDALPAIGEEIVTAVYYLPADRPEGMEGECPALNLLTRR